MIETAMPLAFATLLLTSSVIASPTPSSSVSSQIIFTQVLPEKNYVRYIVGNEETLKTIAVKYYGDEAYWTDIWNTNEGIDDPENVQPGLLLKIKPVKTEKPEELKKDLLQKLPKPAENTSPAYVYQSVIAPQSSIQEPTPAAPSSYDVVYQQAGAKYGIPWQILYGLHMTETGGRNGAISGGGPQGPMQFMPGTWNSYSVDGDGDGNANINDATDAIYTAANFIARHGSVEAGLRAYGGNNAGVMQLARSKGYGQ